MWKWNVLIKLYHERVRSSRAKYRSNVQKTACSDFIMRGIRANIKPQLISVKRAAHLSV